MALEPLPITPTRLFLKSYLKDKSVTVMSSYHAWLIYAYSSSHSAECNSLPLKV